MKQQQGILSLEEDEQHTIAAAIEFWTAECVDDPADAAQLRELGRALTGSDVYLIPRPQA